MPCASTREFSVAMSLFPSFPPPRCGITLLVLYSMRTLPGGTFGGGDDLVLREFWIGDKIKPSIAATIRILRASAGMLLRCGLRVVWRRRKATARDICFYNTLALGLDPRGKKAGT
jgi:hypothetical protein